MCNGRKCLRPVDININIVECKFGSTIKYLTRKPDININIVECKLKKTYPKAHIEPNININIVECKLNLPAAIVRNGYGYKYKHSGM